LVIKFNLNQQGSCHFIQMTAVFKDRGKSMRKNNKAKPIININDTAIETREGECGLTEIEECHVFEQYA